MQKINIVLGIQEDFGVTKQTWKIARLGKLIPQLSSRLVKCIHLCSGSLTSHIYDGENFFIEDGTGEKRFMFLCGRTPILITCDITMFGSKVAPS